MQNRNLSTTLLKGLNVLLAFDDTEPELTQAELARRTGYDRATVRRLCLSLAASGFAIQTAKGFRLSPRVLMLAGSFLRSNDIGYALQPILNEHSLKLKAELSVAVLDGEHALLIAQSQLPEARISFGLTVGSALPLLPTATGRMLLSAFNDSEQRNLLEQLPNTHYTQTTCTDIDEIKNKLERIAMDQSAVVKGEFEVGICGIAVPVLCGGKTMAVVGTSIPIKSPQFNKRVVSIVNQLQSTARQLAALRYFRENALCHPVDRKAI